MRLVDNKKALTAEDLIRRYNLEQLKKDAKVIQNLKDSLEKTDKLIEKLVKCIYPYAINQIDEYITIWFFNGIPTKENEPFIYYDSSKLDERLNDFYYDKDTGNIYIFSFENETYFWRICEDDELNKLLAVVNSKADVTDNKRNFYIGTPIPPYDVGDIWFDNGTIKRCRCSRDNDIFHETDWCLQKDYDDNFFILETRAIINQIETIVTKDLITSAQLEATKNSIIGTVTSETTKITQKLNDYATVENVESVKQKVETLQTSNKYAIDVIEDIQNNGVSKVKIDESFTFDRDGLTIDEINSPTKFNADTNGIEVIDKTSGKDETLLFAGFDESLGETVVKSRNFVVEKYLNIGKNSRLEDYELEEEKPGTGVFFVG